MHKRRASRRTTYTYFSNTVFFVILRVFRVRRRRFLPSSFEEASVVGSRPRFHGHEDPPVPASATVILFVVVLVLVTVLFVRRGCQTQRYRREHISQSTRASPCTAPSTSCGTQWVESEEPHLPRLCGALRMESRNIASVPFPATYPLLPSAHTLRSYVFHCRWHNVAIAKSCDMVFSWLESVSVLSSSSASSSSSFPLAGCLRCFDEADGRGSVVLAAPRCYRIPLSPSRSARCLAGAASTVSRPSCLATLRRHRVSSCLFKARPVALPRHH